MEEEFALASALIGAHAKLSQEEVARMESGRCLPSSTSMVKYDKAMGHKVQIKLKAGVRPDKKELARPTIPGSAAVGEQRMYQ